MPVTGRGWWWLAAPADSRCQRSVGRGGRERRRMPTRGQGASMADLGTLAIGSNGSDLVWSILILPARSAPILP